LVITDINMPDINGLELVRFIRKSDQHKNTKGAADLDPILREGPRARLFTRSGRLPGKTFSPESLREEARSLLARVTE
jgi:two-component system chemotaxis response regulator CheY